MKCPTCKREFDPWKAERWKQKGGTYIRCPHCMEKHKIGTGRK